jgi:hypothetical protein
MSAERPAKPTLSPLQLVGSALAAATSAVVASFFGVAGTVIGAALASVITTISATLYSASLRKTNERLHDLSNRLGGRRPTAGATQVLPQQPATRELPAALDPRRAPPRSRRSYVRVAAGTAAVFVAAMVIVTGIELIGQRPVSALVTGSSSKGTTVGDLTTAGSQKPPPSTPAPTTSTPTTAPATPSGTSESTATSSSSAARTSTVSPTPSSTAASSSAPTPSQDGSTPTP